MHPLLRAAYSAAGLAATALARVVPATENKVVRSFRGRRGVFERWERWAATSRDRSRPLVWFHAPSVGEGLQARPVMELVRARHPQVQLAYSYFSPSAERFARGLDADVTDYLPFDTVGGARRLLNALRPTALVFAKLDAWPLLCEETAARRVPLGMVSATVSPTAARRGSLARALLGDAHAAFTAVGAISEDDAQRLAELGFDPRAIRVTGDTRYDQVWSTAQRVDRGNGVVATLTSARPTLVAGSTWPPDDAVLLPAWALVRQAVPTARLIVAPHEPRDTHVLPIEQWAAANRLSSARLGTPGAPTADVVIVDRVGILGAAYAVANAAFVGGGFHSAGLHSVLEPAAYGIPIAFGPMHTNSRDAGLLIAHDAAFAVTSARETADVLVRWLNKPDEARLAGAAARALVEGGLGAAERAYELVMGLVATSAA